MPRGRIVKAERWSSGYAKVTDDEFVAAWQEACGNARKVSELTGIGSSKVFHRRRTVEKRRGIILQTTATSTVSANKAFFKSTIENGTVLVGTDPHYWPGPLSTMQRAFLYFVKHMEPRPRIVVLNGDIFDGARISRHPRIGFLENRPTVNDEIEVCKDRLHEIVEAAPVGATFVWPLGNHDLRYEAYLANKAPEYEGVEGLHLKDKFPRWHPCWTFWINEGGPGFTEITHRFRGGIHCTYNNTLHAGVNILTGHDHDAQIYRKRDRRGKRYGIDAGTLAEVHHDEVGNQFVHYLEANPTNWESCFVVLTYRDGKLMRPEFVEKWSANQVEFRGAIIDV